MALEGIKKWMKEHDPNKPVKPEALGKGTRKVTRPKTKKTTKAKAPAKTSKKTTSNKLVPKGKVPIPAQKRDGKTAAVAAKPSDRDVASRTTDKVKPKTETKRPSLGIVPKGKQYKSAGLVKSLGILPKKESQTAKAKAPKYEAAMKKKKPKEKKAGFLNQLFGG